MVQLLFFFKFHYLFVNLFNCNCEQVIVAAVERCLDPIPLELPILDRLVQAKLAQLAQHREQDLI